MQEPTTTQLRTALKSSKSSVNASTTMPPDLSDRYRHPVSLVLPVYLWFEQSL